MKKLIALILILAVLVPAAVLAEEPDFFGAYTMTLMMEKDRDAPFISSIKFSENGTCYYCEQMFYSDRPGASVALIGEWEYNEDGDIVVKLGRTHASFTLHFLKDGDLINTETMGIYNRVNAVWVSR